MADSKKIDHVINVLLVILAIVGVITIHASIGRLDGLLFPVARVTHFEIAGEVDGDALVAGRFDKLRDCSFIRSEWYRGKNLQIDFERVDQVNEVPRGDGHRWGVLRLDTSPMSVREGIRAINVSRCSIFGIPLPWKTVTVSYNGAPPPL